MEERRMIAILFTLLLIGVLTMVLALCRNAKMLDEKEWREMERDLMTKHLEKYNQ
jgi:hypothetical protein